VVVALADQPLIGATTCKNSSARSKSALRVPRHVQPSINGEPGNTIMFTAAVREQILAGEARIGCRHWQADNPQRVHRWTTNLRYRTDVDSPDDIRALEQRTGHRLRWPAHLAVDGE
jgi:CTP:molybdopterin cytidylyltransferase MocA